MSITGSMQLVGKLEELERRLGRLEGLFVAPGPLPATEASTDPRREIASPSAAARPAARAKKPA